MSLNNRLSKLSAKADKIGTFVNKNKFVLRIVNRGNLAFFYGIFLFLYEIAFLRHVVPVVHPFLIAWAFLVIGYDCFVRKVWSIIPQKIPLLLFTVSAIVTALLNIEAGIIGNIKAWVMIAIPLFAFYPVCIDSDSNNRKKTLIKSMLGASTVCFFSAIIALVTYFMQISKELVFFNDKMTLGYRYYIPGDPSSGMLLYGVYEDTNHSAAYTLVFTAISLLIFINCEKGLFEKLWVNKALKVYAVANMIVQMCYFPMANSRGAWIALLVSLFVITLLYLYCTIFYKLSKKSRIIKSTALTLAVVVVVSIGIIGIRTMVSGVSNAITYISDEMSSDGDGAVDDGAKPDEKPTDDNKFLIDSFNKKDEYMGGGRLYIWQDTFSLVKKMPLFGNGPGNNEYFAQKYDVAKYTLAMGKHVHNSYLDLLLNYGIVGFLIMLTFLALCAKDILKKILIDGESRDFSYYLITFLLLVVTITSFFLSSVFINTTAISFIMFVSLGYLVSEKMGKTKRTVTEI